MLTGWKAGGSQHASLESRSVAGEGTTLEMWPRPRPVPADRAGMTRRPCHGGQARLQGPKLTLLLADMGAVRGLALPALGSG